MSKDEKPKNEKDALGNLIHKGEAEKKEIRGSILGGILLICLLVLLFKGGSIVIEYFGDKSDHKAYCSKHYTVLEAKTDFAAKKAYKACLKRD